MLEGIVEHHNLYAEALEVLDALAAVFVHCNRDIGEFAVQLHRLVAEVKGCAVGVGQDKPRGATLIATAEHRYFMLLPEQP